MREELAAAEESGGAQEVLSMQLVERIQTLAAQHAQASPSLLCISLPRPHARKLEPDWWRQDVTAGLQMADRMKRSWRRREGQWRSSG